METNYDEYQIQELKKTYKSWLIVNFIIYIAIFVTINLIDLPFPENYGYVDKQGTYNYLCGLTKVLNAYSRIILIMVALWLFVAIKKLILKEKYTKFEVARIQKNIRSNWLSNYITFSILIILLVALCYFIIPKELTSFHLNQTGIQCNYSKYNIKIDAEYYRFKNIKVGWDTYTGKKTLRFYEADDEYEIFHLEVGTKSKYQYEMLQVLDERTQYKFNILKQVETGDMKNTPKNFQNQNAHMGN